MGLQGTAFFREQAFTWDRGLQGTEICRRQGFAGWLQASTKSGPRAVCLALDTRVLALSAFSLPVPGFLGGHRAVITTNTACRVVGTWHQADHTGLPQEL